MTISGSQAPFKGEGHLIGSHRGWCLSVLQTGWVWGSRPRGDPRCHLTVGSHAHTRGTTLPVPADLPWTHGRWGRSHERRCSGLSSLLRQAACVTLGKSLNYSDPQYPT